MIATLEKFEKRPTKSVAADLIEELSELNDKLDEAASSLQDLTGYLDEWTDEEADKESVADARDNMESTLSELIEQLKELRDSLV